MGEEEILHERVMNIVHGTFTPLVFTIHGSTGTESTNYHKNLADQIAVNTGDDYAKGLTFRWCKLSFIVLKSNLLCLCGIFFGGGGYLK